MTSHQSHHETYNYGRLVKANINRYSWVYLRQSETFFTAEARTAMSFFFSGHRKDTSAQTVRGRINPSSWHDTVMKF